jgi:FkbM family methyltransferase
MSTVFYKSKDGQNHPIKFYDLLDEGWNMDKFIREGTVFSRPDHNYSALLKYLNPGDVVYDCGAYIGTFAIPFAIEGMKVHAFEAWPGNSERCRKNFVPYDITLHEVALSDRNEQKNAQIIHCMGWEYYDPQEYRLIEYVRLDDYISKNSLPNPSLIKMDIEGMESLAMLGATNLLEKVRPVWQMGLHLQIKHGVDVPTFPGWVDSIDGGFDWSKINQLDYIVCDYNGNQINPNTILLRSGEYIFVPKEKW